MSKEPGEATIKRRSENAETSMGCLGETLGCAWIGSPLAIVALPAGMLPR